MVEVPVKPVLGVSVRVESDTTAAILLLDEVAEKVRASLNVASDANKDTVLEVLIRVACSFITLTTAEVSAVAAGVEPPPHEERKMSKEHAATNLSILIRMIFLSFRSNVVYFDLFIFYKLLNLSINYLHYNTETKHSYHIDQNNL